MIKSILFCEKNSIAQLELTDMQNQLGQDLKWILSYQDHLKILHKKLIINHLTYAACLEPLVFY